VPTRNHLWKFQHFWSGWGWRGQQQQVRISFSARLDPNNVSDELRRFAGHHDGKDCQIGTTCLQVLQVHDVGLFREHLKGKYHCTIDLLFDRFRNILCIWCTEFCIAQRSTFPNRSNWRSTIQCYFPMCVYIQKIIEQDTTGIQPPCPIHGMWVGRWIKLSLPQKQVGKAWINTFRSSFS